MNQELRIAAIYTTYRPDEEFRKRIRHVVDSCVLTVIVDNTPGGHTFSARQIDGLTLLQDGRNKGLGGALNAGLSEARRQGCNAVVLFDQDSSPAPYFIEKLFQGLAEAGPRALVGPLLVDDTHADPETPTIATMPRLTKVTCVATSGMCFRLDALKPADHFTEELFLDFVDFDWCWRMRKNGWGVYRLMSLPMPHRLGIAQRSFLGLTYHVPAPFRHYFQFRDTLCLVTRGYVPLYSRIRLLAILVPKLLLYPFLLDNGIARLFWMFQGIRDAFRGVTGIGAAAALLQGMHAQNK
jgi:rhamnosyltransferase